MGDTDRQKRAELRRQRITITRCSLEDSDINPNPTFGAEGIRRCAVLSEEAWARSGRPFPNYKRNEIPLRFTTLEDK